jgi:hypothetical protein
MDHMKVSFRIVECTGRQFRDHSFIKFNNESLEYFETISSLLLLANQRCATLDDWKVTQTQAQATKTVNLY